MTWAVQILIFLNSAIFAAQLLLHIPLGGHPGVVASGWVTHFMAFRADLVFKGLLWQPLTYMFLHGGLSHLFFNMLWLFFFGRDVERALGTRQFICFYLLCGAVGVLFTIPPDLMKGAYIPVLGASGAVMGVLVAFAVIDPERILHFLFIPFPINARALVIMVVVWNLVMGLDKGSGVSNWTHFGGMAVGYLYMKVIPKMRQRRIARHRQKVEESVGEQIDKIFEFKKKDR